MTQRLLTLRNTRSGRVADLFDLGLSFGLMLSWGVLPPLETMNDFLACGRDDTDAEDGLLQWEPFSLTAAEYKRLARELRHRGRDVEIEAVPAGRAAPPYEAWFAARLRASPTNPRTAKRPQRH
jgi:hypothetical protein